MKIMTISELEQFIGKIIEQESGCFQLEEEEERNILLQMIPDRIAFELYTEQDQGGIRIVADKKEEEIPKEKLIGDNKILQKHVAELSRQIDYLTIQINKKSESISSESKPSA